MRRMAMGEHLPARQDAGLQTRTQGAGRIPSLISDAGRETTESFVEFFASTIPNRNTRTAYLQAVTQFSDWCEERKLSLKAVSPIVLAAYREQHTGSLPTIKQHFSALRMLFAWFVEKGITDRNPVREVKTAKFSRGEGKTPAFSVEEIKQLFASFDTESVVGLRDRALIGVMAYTFARVDAATSLRIRDYGQQGRRAFIRLREKGGKEKEIPCHHQLEEYLDAYLEAATLGGGKDAPLFRTAAGRTGKLTENPMSRFDAWKMVRRRLSDAGILGEFSNHSFRATGITTFLENGGSLESAQFIAGHADSRTTKLYDRRHQRASLEDLERVRY
jgi:site-specific recombinase XerD